MTVASGRPLILFAVLALPARDDLEGEVETRNDFRQRVGLGFGSDIDRNHRRRNLGENVGEGLRRAGRRREIGFEQARLSLARVGRAHPHASHGGHRDSGAAGRLPKCGICSRPSSEFLKARFNVGRRARHSSVGCQRARARATYYSVSPAAFLQRLSGGKVSIRGAQGQRRETFFLLWRQIAIADRPTAAKQEHPSADRGHYERR